MLLTNHDVGYASGGLLLTASYLSQRPVSGPPRRGPKRHGGTWVSQSRLPVWLHISRFPLLPPPPSSDLASDTAVVLAFQNLLLSEQGPMQGQDGHGKDTGCGAPRVKHARLHFDQDKRAIM